MEQIAIQAGAIAGGTPQLQQAQAGAVGQGGMDGLFAAWFDQLLAGLAPEEELAAALPAVAGQADEADDRQMLLGMELMASGLFSPALWQQDAGQGQAAELLAAAGLAEDRTARPLPGRVGGMLLQQAEEAPAPAEGEDARQGFARLVEQLTAAWQGGGEQPQQPGGSLTDQLYFASAMRQAQKALAEKPRSSEAAQAVDLEALQRTADSGRYLFAAVGEQRQAPTLDQIAGQLKTGILENLAQAKKEFVVRLKPEGLGEITVKLLEEKNGISLRIVTSSAAVGRMIAEDVNALQNALRPLNAQVQEIVSPAQPAQDSAAQSYFGAQQDQRGFAWQYDQQQQQQQNSRGGQPGGQGFDGLVEEALPQDAALNLLI